MRISTATGKIEFITDSHKLKSFDEFTDILKLVEAASILERHANPSEVKIIVKILAVMQKLYKFKNPDERAKAQALTQEHILPISTKLPVYTAISRYNRQDLALAFSHIFYDDLPCELIEVTDLTEQGAVLIAIALLDQFNPTAIPNDLESKARGQMGEFVRFEGKPMAFFTAVEMKRAYQYEVLGKKYSESKRYQRLQELLEAQAGQVEKISTVTPALPAPNPPEKLLILKPVEQEEDVQEIYVEEVEYQEDDFLDDSSFVDADEVVDSDGVEVMDIDVGDEQEQSPEYYDWMKDIDVKKK